MNTLNYHDEYGPFDREMMLAMLSPRTISQRLLAVKMLLLLKMDEMQAASHDDHKIAHEAGMSVGRYSKRRAKREKRSGHRDQAQRKGSRKAARMAARGF